MRTQTVRFTGVPFKITKLKRSRGGKEWRLRWYDTLGKRQTKTYRSEGDARLAANDNSHDRGVERFAQEVRKLPMAGDSLRLLLQTEL